MSTILPPARSHASLWLWLALLLAVSPLACSDNGSAPISADGDCAESEQAQEDDTEADSAEAEEESGPYDAWTCQGHSVGAMLGVATHMNQGAGDDADRNFEFARYDELGAAIIREHFRWDDIEPKEDEYHFEEVAEQVRLAKEHHVKIVAQVGYDVGWATYGGEGDSALSTTKYAEFVGRVATEYCDSITDYELWNEPDMTTFWEPTPDPVHYGLMVKAAYPAIKAACPAARVSLGGMASYSNVDLYNHWWFLKALYKAHPDIADYFDVISLHPYTFMDAQTPEYDRIKGSYRKESQERLLALAREVASDMGKPEAPIWFTEIGWTSLLVQEDKVASYLTRSALLAARDKVEYYLWYTFYDTEPEPDDAFDNWSNYFGLFGWPGDATAPRREKPAWLAFKGLSKLLGTACFAHDLSSDLALPNDVYALGFTTPDGKRLLALWDGRESPDEIEGVKSPGGLDTRYELRLPLPPKAKTLKVYDPTGALLKTESAVSPYALTLTPDVLFVAIEE